MISEPLLLRPLLLLVWVVGGESHNFNSGCVHNFNFGGHIRKFLLEIVSFEFVRTHANVEFKSIRWNCEYNCSWNWEHGRVEIMNTYQCSLSIVSYSLDPQVLPSSNRRPFTRSFVFAFSIQRYAVWRKQYFQTLVVLAVCCQLALPVSDLVLLSSHFSIQMTAIARV